MSNSGPPTTLYGIHRGPIMTYKELQAARDDGTVLVHRYAGYHFFSRAIKVWRDPLVGRVAKIQPMDSSVYWGGVRAVAYQLREEEWEDLRPATAEELLTSKMGLRL